MSRATPDGYALGVATVSKDTEAFVGPMAELLCALEDGGEPSLNGRDNLGTMALVEACYRSAREHRAVDLCEFGLD